MPRYMDSQEIRERPAKEVDARLMLNGCGDRGRVITA